MFASGIIFEFSKHSSASLHLPSPRPFSSSVSNVGREQDALVLLFTSPSQQESEGNAIWIGVDADLNPADNLAEAPAFVQVFTSCDLMLGRLEFVYD